MSSGDDKCCLCFDLRVGCLTIGYISLVGEIIALIFVGLMTVAGAAIYMAENEDDSQITTHTGLPILIVSLVLLLFLTLFLAFTIVLLVGIHQNKRGHVKAYLIYSVIFQVIFFIVFLASFASRPIVAGDVIKNVITIGLNVYFLFVIQKFYRKMDEYNEKGVIFNSA